MLRIAFPITPSDSVPVDAHEAIYVGGTGNLSVTTRIPDGQGGFTESTVSLTGIQAGVFHPMAVHRINATGTTATGIVGWR